MKFSHKAELKLSNTNLDLKEGEGCLAKHGCGGDEGFAWSYGHGGAGISWRWWRRREKVERKWDEVRESEVGVCGKHEI